jgi:phosphomannomutase
VKVYLEVIEPVAGAESLASAKQTAASRLAGLRADLETITALP